MNPQTYLDLDESKSGIEMKLCELRDHGISWYRSEVMKCFEIGSLPSMDDDKIVASMLISSSGQDKSYYLSNAIVYLKVIQNLTSEEFLNPLSNASLADNSLAVYNYAYILRNLLFDSLILMNQYNEKIGKPVEYNSIFKNPIQHTRTIYESLKQSIYGQSSFHSFIELESNISISIIRQLVELRVRRAIGVEKWMNKDNPKNIAMIAILNSFEKHQESMDLSMPFKNLKLINQWANQFLHSGVKDYIWKPIFLLTYIKEFSSGKTLDRGQYYEYDANFGISMSQATLDKIVDDIEREHKVKGIRFMPEIGIIS